MPYILYVTKALQESKRLFFSLLESQPNFQSYLFFFTAWTRLLLLLNPSVILTFSCKSELHFPSQTSSLPKCKKLFYFSHFSLNSPATLICSFQTKEFPTQSTQGQAACNMACAFQHSLSSGTQRCGEAITRKGAPCTHLISQEDVSEPLQLHLIKHLITGWLLRAKRVPLMSLLMPSVGICGPRGTFQGITSNICSPATDESCREKDESCQFLLGTKRDILDY